METIITRCPARISFGNGGDTDYYLKELGWGCVVNATLSTLFFECQILSTEERAIIYNDLNTNTSEKNILTNLRLEGDKLDLIKATISYLHPYFKKSIAINTNIPKESGLGGSSTLNIAVALALLKEKGELTNAEELARISYHIERKILQVEGGYQDQWAAAYGRGLNLMIFKNKKVEVIPIKIPKDILRKLEENSLLVYFSQRTDSGKEIHKDQEKRMKENPEEKSAILLEKRENTLKIKEYLEKGNLDQFAECLNKDWELKQKLSSKIAIRDEIFQIAMNNGALGGRLCGAGSGGTYYFYCKDGGKKQVLNAIKPFIQMEMPFKIQRAEEQGNMYQS